MDEGEANKSKHAQDVRNSWFGDTTSDATGGTSHHLKEAEDQAAKDTEPGNGFGSFGEKSDDGNENTALSANARENGVRSGSVGGGFLNKVTGTSGDQKVKTKGFFKKNGPTITIITMVLGGIFGYGSASFFCQMAMPISLLKQFKDNFGSINIISQTRTKRFIKWQTDVDSRKVKNCIKSRIFGADKFKISSRQRQKLARAGITVDSDSFDYTVMRFTGSDGVERIIVPDSRQATDGKIAFSDAYETNMEFRNSYTDGAKTWRGQVSDWFDSLADKFLSFIGINRSNWGDFKVSDDPKVNEENYKQKVADVADGDSMDGDAHIWSKDEDKVNQETGEVDEGEVHDNMEDLTLSKTDVEVDGNGKVTNTDSLKNKLEAFSNSKLTKVASIAGMAANMTCAVFDVVGAINLIVMAYQTTQILKVASTLFESVDKAQVEDSSTTPIHEVGNSLTTPYTKTYETDSGPITRKKSAMEANAIGALYGNIKGDPNDTSVTTFKIGSSLSKIGSAIGSSMMSFQSCTYAKMAAAVVGASMDIIDIALCIVSMGIGCAVDALGDLLTKVAGSVIISTAIGFIVQFLVPFVANILTRKIATDVMGEDLGNALVSGANIYMGQNHQYSGGSVASQGSLTKFLTAKEQVLADRARVERETKSPFDASSPYTFMGTLLTKTIPIISEVGSATSAVSSFNNIVGNSIKSMMPGASAVSAAVTAQSAAADTANSCPDLAAVGGVGDQFCNPYFISDLSTVDDDPAGIVNKVDALGGFEDSDGEQDVPTIKKDSKLAKYIVYCGQRESPFGIADQNIASDFDKGSTGSSVLDAIIGGIPVVGDVADIISNKFKADNFGYISGKTCVTDNDTTGDAPDWSETKKYQRFIEDQRLAESMGLVEKSAVSAFLDDYYKEHPIDNSYEGILARRSGLTKENVIATLQVMEGMQFIADYEPKDLAPYPAEEVDEERIVLEENVENKLDQSGIIATIINSAHFDYTQRNYAV